MSDDLESIVRQYVHLPNLPSGKGWFSLKCRLCNDYKRRAGFKFDHNTIVYNCFNCAHDAKFITTEHNSVPDKMLSVFDAYGIPKSDFNSAVFKGFVLRSKNENHTEEETPSVPLVYNNLKMPTYFRPLVTDGTGDVYDELACEYLITERAIDPTAYPFLMAEKEDCSGALWKQWKARLIIPYYRNGNLIFYQGRDLINSDRTKYLSPQDSRDTVLYGYDEIYTHSDKPIYIHEGFFDAFLVKDSVAIFSNKITDQQIEVLNRCPRKKVVIPDRQGKGYLLAQDGLRQGWSVSFPDIGSSCKDMNDAIMKYGRLYVLKSIVDNTASGFAAETLIKLYCKE